MTAFFISLLAVLIVIALLGDSEASTNRTSTRHRSWFGMMAALCVSILAWTSALCVANQQTGASTASDKPAVKAPIDSASDAEPPQDVSAIQSSSVKSSSVEDIIKTNDGSKSVPPVVKEPAKDGLPVGVTDSEAADSSDIFFVMTKEGLNKLIAASGGDIEAFDVETLRQASAFMPLSLSQSRTLSPVLRTAVSPMMLKRLFDPTNLKMIQELLRNSAVKAETTAEIPPIDHEAWSQFLMDNSWIENPGIGQVVTKTGMVEKSRSQEIAREVQSAIRKAVAGRVQKLAKEKYGESKLDTSKMDLSFFDPSQAIAQTAQWQEQVYENGDSDNVMVQTHVLVDLPKKEIDLLMAGVKTELQKERLFAIGIVIGLFWFGIALSSVAFRTFHSKSRIWKLIAIPVLSLAVIPCLVGAALMVGEMYSGNLF